MGMGIGDGGWGLGTGDGGRGTGDGGRGTGDGITFHQQTQIGKFFATLCKLYHPSPPRYSLLKSSTPAPLCRHKLV